MLQCRLSLFTSTYVSSYLLYPDVRWRPAVPAGRGARRVPAVPARRGAGGEHAGQPRRRRRGPRHHLCTGHALYGRVWGTLTHSHSQCTIY